ncbi:MAG: glycosyltransferase family 2 protein [Jiangellaceae bacterium]
MPIAKRIAKRTLRALGLRNPKISWVTTADHPADPDPLPSFGLFAIIVTWMEADVIAATVHNAFTQGCDRVFLVDNDSPDDTVAEAVAAGAELARSFSTRQLDELFKIKLLNEVAAEVSQADGREHIWWLWLDADEFVHGPDGRTIREFLTPLDRSFRIVGTRYFNHFPDRKPESLPGFHPLDLQPLCQEKRGNQCRWGHRKHPLQRFDRSGPPITCGIGYHAATCPEALFEPTDTTFTHHFPYRLEAATRLRSETLCGRDGKGVSRVEAYDQMVRSNAGTVSDMSKRFRTLDHVYAQDWPRVENLRRQGSPMGVEPEPWTTLVDPADASSARWYSPADLAVEVAQQQAPA